MKKTLILGTVFLISGFIFGKFIHNNNEGNIITTFNEKNMYYFLQEGVYTSKDAMEENSKNIRIKATDYKNDKYYVYLGITGDYNIAKKLKEIYEKEGYQISIKKDSISNEEFYNNVTQFDILIKNTDNKEEILTIEEVVLANFEETTKKE